MQSQKPKKSFGSVLVVGGCGFLGRHIVSQLLENFDAKVSVVDLRTDHHRFSSLTYYDADITSQSAIASVLESEKPAVIIHTASPSFVGDEGKNKALYKKVNVDGTQNLIDRAEETGCVKAFVYTSSASVIHDSISDLVNADERWPTLRAPLQREYYSETKAMAEEIVLAANRKRKDMLTIAIRPSGIFGEGDQQVVPGLLKAYYGKKTKFQLGDNMNLFDFTYVGNVAYAHILAVIALMNTHELPTIPLDHEKVDGEAFLITNGTPVYFWDFARLVWRAAGDQTDLPEVWTIGKDIGLKLASLLEWLFWFAGGRKPSLSWKAFNYSSMTRYYNIDKARTMLGYKPLFDMEEGVQRTVKYIQEQEERAKAEKDQKKSQ